MQHKEEVNLAKTLQSRTSQIQVSPKLYGSPMNERWSHAEFEASAQIPVSQHLSALAAQYGNVAKELACTAGKWNEEYHHEWNLALRDSLPQLSNSQNAKAILDCSKQNVSTPSTSLRGARTILGICGPGAVGKDTIERRLQKSDPQFHKVVAYTTRERRRGEVHGKEYKYCTIGDFERLSSSNSFIHSIERKHRGHYGILRADLINSLQLHQHVTIQESPRALSLIFDHTHSLVPETIAQAIYVLPPLPFFPHLLLRLCKRLVETVANPTETLPSVLESTLGERQICEFLDAVELSHEEEDIGFIINAKPEDAVSQIYHTIHNRADGMRKNE